MRKSALTVAFGCLAGCVLSGAAPVGRPLPGILATDLERGSLPLQTFLPKTFAANPQNWAAVQDSRGVMFFGNPDGVLEFDGVSWRQIPLPGATAVRSLGLDWEGRVAVGGQGEIGFLGPDKLGALRYQSLLSKLKPEDRRFGDVWSVLSTGDSVYFSSYQRLFRWNRDGSIQVWKPKQSFSRAFLVDGSILLAVSGSGLHRVVGTQLESVPGGELFRDVTLRSVFRWNGQLTAATRERLFVLSEGRFRPIATGVDSLLDEYKIYTALPLHDGTLAIGTARGGMLLLDSSGRLLQRLTKENGLPADYVLSIFADRQGSVWLTTSAGLSRFTPTVTTFDESFGLRGGAVTIARQDGRLYAGTQTGLYVLRPGKAGASSHFEHVPELPETVIVLLPSAHGLFAGGQQGIFLVTREHARRIAALAGVYDLALASQDESTLYAVGTPGLTVLRKQSSSWSKQWELPSNGQEFRSVVETGPGQLWISTRSDVLHVDSRQSPPAIEHLDAKNGVPPGWNNWFRIGGDAVLATANGVLRFDPVTRMFRPDSRFPTQFSDGSQPVTMMKEDRSGNVWLAGKGYHGVLLKQADGKYRWQNMALLESGLSEIWTMQFDRDGTVWAAGPEGWVARLEALARRPPSVKSNLLIRTVLSQTAQQMFYSGAGSLAENSKIAHRDASLRFEFASPYFESEPYTEYQVRLEGIDKRWSEWTRETRKDYTNLFEGHYVFHVRARHPQLAETSEATFRFEVMPPWYRSWWALILYALALTGGVSFLVRLRVQQLKESNEKLEDLVEERTTEIRRQRDQIREEEQKAEALLLNILPATVAAELLSTGSVEPKLYEDVTVCFTDFVGFTLSGQSLNARVVVDALHEYFTIFDRIIARYGLEKLKTIGDAYMFVSGLPDRRSSHSLDAVLASLEIAEAVRELHRSRSGVTWDIRIGLHSGPVVSGVVGRNKFAFDIWGDTVNQASRMETCSAPGRVNMSARVYEQVKDFVTCESRGLVETKEGRQVEMFFALGLAAEFTGNQGVEAFRRRYKEAFGVPPKADYSEMLEPSAAISVLSNSRLA